jgi:hypothetical protein
MSENVPQVELRAKTQLLLDGPLKHIRGAVLAAALLPLASVAAAPASAQSVCPSGGICGTVFNDVNKNGVQDAGDVGLENVNVTVSDSTGVIATVQTDVNGFFSLFVAGGDTVQVAVQTPTNFQPSPVVPANCLAVCNDGTSNGGGFSTATTTVGDVGAAVDFGFTPSGATNPGTGTIGYWKNHPDAWPTQSIMIGGTYYSKMLAISWLGRVGKDKTTTMFAQLVAAKLSVMIGNDGSCVNPTIAAADAWMATYGPVGRNVAGGSAAWAAGAPLEQTLDSYNNGLLCAPHRQ